MRRFPATLLHTLTTLAIVAAPLGAQMFEPRAPRLLDQWVLGLSAFGGIPVGEFRQYENGGGGGEIMLGFQPWRRQPLVLRAHFAAMSYGGQTATGYQDVCDNTGCWTEVVQYKARSHSMLSTHIGPEIMATDGVWRPFGYAMAGRTFFRSTANIKPTTPTGPAESSESLFSSSNFSTAYGSGIRRVTTQRGREFGLELSARVTRNASARYLTEDGVYRRSDGTYDVQPRQSAANVLGIHFGIWFGPHINWNER